MICEECKKQRLKSKISIRLGARTGGAVYRFYDEEGRYHSHDPRATAIIHRCSNGHEWVKAQQDHCWCEKKTEFIES